MCTVLPVVPPGILFYLLRLTFIPSKVYCGRGGFVALMHRVELRFPLVGQLVAPGILVSLVHELRVGKDSAGGVELLEKLCRFQAITEDLGGADIVLRAA